MERVLANCAIETDIMSQDKALEGFQRRTYDSLVAIAEATWMLA